MRHPRNIHACFTRAMAQFFLKIAHLSFSMGPAPSLKMVFSYGLRPRLWLLATRNLPCQYIGETKRHLHERFGEHRRSVQNHQQLANPTPVSEHFNLPGHSVNDIRLIPLELIHTNRDSVRKAREAHLIDKAKTLEPQGLNRRDELH